MKPSKQNTEGKFSWTKKDNRVVVYEESTAKGQKKIIGTYEITSDFWHNNRRAMLVPKIVREKIESAYGKQILPT